MCHLRIALVMAIAIFVTAPLGAQEPKLTPAGSLQRLQDGNARFVADKPNKRDVGIDRRKELAKGQHPFAVVLTCADSRVAPELLFDTGLGDLFVLRIGGNIADPAVVGSIEYAVEHLHTPLIVVLGHESCGAISAALDGKRLPGDLGWLVKQVKVGDKLPTEAEARLAAGIRNNAVAAAKDLELRSKIIHEEVGRKKVRIVSAVYSLKTGKVEFMTAKLERLTTDQKKAENVAPPKEPSKAETIPAPVIVERPGPYIVERPARFPRLRLFFQRWR